jgi:hypothetical protein
VLGKALRGLVVGVDEVLHHGLSSLWTELSGQAAEGCPGICRPLPCCVSSAAGVRGCDRPRGHRRLRRAPRLHPASACAWLPPSRRVTSSAKIRRPPLDRDTRSSLLPRLTADVSSHYLSAAPGSEPVRTGIPGPARQPPAMGSRDRPCSRCRWTPEAPLAAVADVPASPGGLRELPGGAFAQVGLARRPALHLAPRGPARPEADRGHRPVRLPVHHPIHPRQP